MSKILIIEDDRNLLENITAFLHEEGFETKADTDGKDALYLIRSWEPDLIICDINLPSKGGYDIRKEIITDSKLKQIPFIYLTAKVEVEDFRKGMRLGADDYIFKPFDLEDLLTSIKIRLEKAQQQKVKIDTEEVDSVQFYSADDKILIKSGNRVHSCFIKNLKFITSQNPYILLKFSGGESTLLRQTINDWEKKLPKQKFIRIHRSTIINTDFIEKISKTDNSAFIVSIKDETENFTISKRNSSRLRELIV